MIRVVCQSVFGRTSQRLIFDDWTWQYVESIDDEGIEETTDLNVSQALELFESHFKSEFETPIEIVFQTAYPEPFLVDANSETYLFDPKGWTLYGFSDTADDKEFGKWFDWRIKRFVFGADGTWIEVSQRWHYEARDGAPPRLRFIDRIQAADFLVTNGYRLPKELEGQGRIKKLRPAPTKVTENLSGTDDKGQGNQVAKGLFQDEIAIADEYQRLVQHANEHWAIGTDNRKLCDALESGPSDYTTLVETLLPCVTRSDQTKRFHTVKSAVNKHLLKHNVMLEVAKQDRNTVIVREIG